MHRTFARLGQGQSRSALLLLTVALAGAGACRNSSDHRVLEAAKSLVPPSGEITDVSENTGLRIESGPYYVRYEITDGGLGADLEAAIDDRATSIGWQQTERNEHDAIQLRYERDDLRALIYVFTRRDPVTASLYVRVTDERDHLTER